MLLPRRSQLPTNRARHEQDEDDGGGDPERPVQIRVALQDIEEVGAWVQCGPAAFEHLVGVDVEELRVEGDGPEEFLGGAAAAPRGSAARGTAEGGGVGRDLVARRVGLFEVCGALVSLYIQCSRHGLRAYLRSETLDPPGDRYVLGHPVHEWHCEFAASMQCNAM